jgi:WD40 repeat protein
MVTGNIGTWSRIWLTSDRNVIQELFGHADVVTDFAFCCNDETLFTASKDKTIDIWKHDLLVESSRFYADTIRTQKTVITAAQTEKSTSANFIQIDTTLPKIISDISTIPTMVGGRKVELTTTIEISDTTLDIFVFDNSTIDGDIMSLCFNNQWIISNYEVTKSKRKITIRLNQNSNNYLVLFANNLGKTPPNTAAISFFQKKKERIFMLKSDLKSCSAINFIYKKK